MRSRVNVTDCPEVERTTLRNTGVPRLAAWVVVTAVVLLMSFASFAADGWGPKVGLSIIGNVLVLAVGRFLLTRGAVGIAGPAVPSGAFDIQPGVLFGRGRLAAGGSFDSLTGLPDRTMFKALLETALTAHRQPGHVAVLFFDIDRFKMVNDTLGHPFGDALLSAMADRFIAAAGMDAVVGRLGGDEFGALVQGAQAASRAVELAEKLTNALSHNYQLGNHDVFVTTSGGVAVNENASAADILRKADIAVYRAKAHGRACFAVFDPAVDELSEDRLRLDSGLRRAVDRHQLALHYQPEHDLATGEVVGMEALIRWDHPHRGLLMPATFLEIAEESGEIVRIGDWALSEACKFLRELLDAGSVPADFTVAVNISATELLQGDVLASVKRALAEARISPGNLKLELTETVVMRDIGLSIQTLNSLKTLGVHLAIDDFGTGYSSLSYIHKLPFDTLKIDQSFVRPLDGPEDERALAIVASIVYLGRASMMQVTAEGVETQWQHDYLRTVGAHTAQGFHFSHPLPASDFRQYLERDMAERQEAA